jgi:hypothetical protein
MTTTSPNAAIAAIRPRPALLTRPALALAVLVGALAAGAVAASAHHSYAASYDLSRTVTVEGTITEVSYANPHVEFVVETGDDPATAAVEPTEEWLISTSGPARAGAAGLTPEVLTLGEEAAVVGWPAWDGSLELGASTITVGAQFFQMR